ncbi:glucose 1-dehydrogenase [Actinomadura sp. NPDC048394]|uniref:glucose 1-dehydrogenase n=1 Tax=Actinomadura sp. NPDC048394 TaxID=3158223 RepID=UPI0033D3E225
MRLDGKVAVVTGAARGQGEAEARMLAEAGARVVLTDVLEAEGAALAGSIGDAARFIRHDVASADDWERVVAVAREEFGGVDVLVNNAAIWRTAPVADETRENFEEILRINLVGPFLGVRAVVPAMRERGGGSIVNISSTAGLRGIRGHSAYGASKFGLRGLTLSAALDLGADGIRVNSVHPGVIDTPMIASIGVERGAGKAPRVPLGRAGIPEDVAGLVLFLASDASAYITGAELAVDGGLSTG